MVQELAHGGCLHTTDAGTIVLVRQPSLPLASDTQRPVGCTACSLNDEPIRIYAPLLMRPCVMQACHSTASCHLGTALPTYARTFLLGGYICNYTRWWLRNCWKCQARKTSRQTVRWPTITLSLPEGPSIAVSIDYFGLLPVTPRGNTYILLFTDRFSR